MAINLSGPISIGGSVVGQSINLELSRVATATTNLNETEVRNLAGIASGELSLDSFYGKSVVQPGGLTWTYNSSLYSSTTTENINAIANYNNIFIAVSSTGSVYSSNDGNTWVLANGNLSSTAWSSKIIFDCLGSANLSKIVIVGESGAVATSSDGYFWQYQTNLSTTLWGSDTIRKINYNGSLFVVVGDNGKIATSSDAIAWTFQANLSSTGWGTSTVRSIFWTGTQWIVGGDGGKLATSSDSINWTYRSGLISTAWGTSTVYGITQTGSTFVVCGAQGKIATSTDLVNWTFRSGLSNSAWSTADALVVKYIASKNIVLVAGANGKLATSTDGITWDYISNISGSGWGSDATSKILDIGISPSKIVLVGDKRKLATAAITERYPSTIAQNLLFNLRPETYPTSGTTWIDSSNNQYPTTIIGTPSASPANGYSSYITLSSAYIDTNQALSAEEFTIAIWCKTTTTGTRMLIGKETPSGGPWNYRLFLSSGYLYGDIVVAGQGIQDLRGVGLIDGKWHLAVFTRDESNWYLYKDYTQIATRTDPYTAGTSIVNSQEVWIGRSAYAGGSYQFSDGSIGESFIFNRSLTPAEIKQLYEISRWPYFSDINA